jgi:hypothetical protein
LKVVRISFQIVLETQKLKKRLLRKQRKLSARGVVLAVVGYSAPHAVYVHEIGPPDRNYKQGKSHKFLERPMREEKDTVIEILKSGVSGDQVSMRDSLRRAGNHLLKKSKEIVPVDTGELRDSGFVHVYG